MASGGGGAKLNETLATMGIKGMCGMKYIF
jgi:hypothetical protein